MLPPQAHAELTVGQESANSSVRLDFDTPTALGRVTCWSSGAFHAEIIDADSERNLLDLHGEFNSMENLALQLRAFLATLGIQSARKQG